MTSPRLTICLSLAAAGLLIWGVSHRLAARGSAAAELIALRRMGHPISLAELAARFPPVPPAENAGSALEAVLAQVTDNSSDSTAAALLDPDRGPTKPWTESEWTTAGALVATNATVFASLHDILQRPRTRLVTNMTAGYGAHLPEVFGFINAGRVLAVSARWAAQQRQTVRAAAQLGDALALARVLGEEPVCLIMVLGSSATANLALGGLEAVLDQTRFQDAELRQLQAGLDRCWSTNLIERAIVAELCFGLSLADHAATNAGALLAPGTGGGLYLKI